MRLTLINKGLKPDRALESYTDARLIELYKSRGDKNVVGILFKRYTAFVFAVCNKYLRNSSDSKDAVMQIFEKLFDGLKRHQISNFKPWLYSVARNHCLQQLRGAKVHVPIDGDSSKKVGFFMENGSASHQDAGNLLEERIASLEMEICNLSHEQRTCIELFYLKGKSYKEVTEATGYSLNEVKSYLQNGKRNLKIGLIKNESE